ncbi:hypothetical protein B6U84_02000 [Candidatus Bathyarchaeota archaeon ex4484_40]|nr:MAG: hypothetical protein B6U84_02000 [Candidatus Bathyarchaeota archaeon ex4484_40]
MASRGSRRLWGNSERRALHLSDGLSQERNIFNEKGDVAEKLHAKPLEFSESSGTRNGVLKYWRKLS